MTIVIAGILSTVVYNTVNVSTFKAEGSSDEVAAAVRYGHKLAVAQRRNVYVSGSGNSLSLCYDAGCSSYVIQPPGTNPFTVTASGAVSVSPGFNFDSLGRPVVSGVLATSAVQITVAGGARTLKVEPQTGFVHFQ